MTPGCQMSGMPFVSGFTPVFQIIKCACACVYVCARRWEREQKAHTHSQRGFNTEQELFHTKTHTFLTLLCMCLCVLSVWVRPVSCASAEEEIHFTSSDSIKEPKTLWQHFCHTLSKSLTLELSVPGTKIRPCSVRERWSDWWSEERLRCAKSLRLKSSFLSFCYSPLIFRKTFFKCHFTTGFHNL